LRPRYKIWNRIEKS